MKCRKLMAIVSVFTACLTFSPMFSSEVYAEEDCGVIYEGQAEKFVFIPESTDLFRNFKNLYPGDSVTQQITFRNNCDTDVAVYLRAEAVDKEYCDFLDNMILTVSENGGTVISFSKASEQGSLKDNMLIGELAPNENTDLNITLDIDRLMDNDCQDMTGKVRWIFSVVEKEKTVTFDKPDSIETGDSRKSIITAAIVLLVISLSAAIILNKKRKYNI